MNLFSIKNLPLSITVGFNLFTLFVFYTAPIDWKTENLIAFLFFALFCQFMVVLGYNSGFKKFAKKNVSLKRFKTLSVKQLNFVFIFYFFTVIIKYAYILRFQILDIKGMVSFLLIGLFDSHLGYQLSLDSSRPYTVSWTIYFIISLIDQGFFIAGFILWKKLNKLKKLLFVFFVFFEMFFWLGRGTNFGIITLITTFVFALVYRLSLTKFDLKKKLFFFLLVLAMLVSSVSVFSIVMGNRRQNTVLDYSQFQLGLSTVNEYSPVFSVIPQPLHDTYMYMVSYLTQGYYHTCLAFDLDYQTTLFMGNNPALIDMAKIFNVDVWPDTYMYRLRQKGVDPLVNWHSAYTWFACDFTFVGVPFIMLALGYFLGISWNLTLSQDDFLSKIIFIVIGNILLFTFANNTYLSSVFYMFMWVAPLWYFTRVKKLKA